jgi:hypothetical protein
MHKQGRTTMTFPTFYAECAFNDGFRDARDGTNSTASYMRHGDPEPIGMEWYQRGRESFAAQVSA